MKRSILALLLAVVLIFTLVACAKDRDEDNDNTPPSSSTGQEGDNAGNVKPGEKEEEIDWGIADEVGDGDLSDAGNNGW